MTVFTEKVKRLVGPGYPRGVLYGKAEFYPWLTPSRDDPAKKRWRRAKGGKLVEVQVRTGISRDVLRALVKSANSSKEYRKN